VIKILFSPVDVRVISVIKWPAGNDQEKSRQSSILDSKKSNHTIRRSGFKKDSPIRIVGRCVMFSEAVNPGVDRRGESDFGSGIASSAEAPKVFSH
jgi:hypothetical protein